MNWYEKAAAEFNKKYYVATKRNGEDWVVRCVTNNKNVDESKIFESTPIGEMKSMQFATFRISQWASRRPYQLIDCRDRSNEKIPAAVGMWLVNQADAGYF